MMGESELNPIWVVVGSKSSVPGIIDGGSQSARNLLLGLRDRNVPFTPVVQSAGPCAAVIKPTGEFGPTLELRIPPPVEWADPAATGLLESVVASNRPRLIHWLDPVPHLGSWLRAVRDQPILTVYTALDYNWICSNSHLLTRRMAQCPGPHSAGDCLRCHFDHRAPVRRIGMRALNLASRLPGPLTFGPARDAKRMRDFTTSRLSSLPRDFERLQALIAPSRSLGDRFAANGLSRRKIFPVPYGTRPGTPIPLADRPPLSDGVVFGFAGRVEYDKGPDLLLDAVESIRSRTEHRPKLIVFCGASSTVFHQQIRKRMASAGRDWATTSQFDGRDPSAIDAAHRRLHFFVAPSRWTDNLPNSLLEALERRTPLIGPDQGSLAEIIDNGRNGWLYPPHEPRTGLTDLLEKVVAEPERYWNLPFDSVRTRSPSAEADDVLNVYRSIGWTTCRD